MHQRQKRFIEALLKERRRRDHDVTTSGSDQLGALTFLHTHRSGSLKITAHAALIDEGVVMFGFIVGTACLLGFIAVYKRGRRHGFGGFAPRWLFRKLDTSPAQERVLRNAMDAVRGDARQFASDSRDARRDLANILRSPDYDRERVRDWFAAREADFQRVRESAVAALGDAFEVLDDQQREKLAQMIEKTRYGHRVCHHHQGPYRSQGVDA